MTHTGRYCEGLHTKGITLDKTFKFILKSKSEDDWDGTEDLDAQMLYKNLISTSIKRKKHLCLSKQGARKFLKLR